MASTIVCRFRGKRSRLSLLLSLILVLAQTGFGRTPATAVDYFKGTWSVAIKGVTQSFTWTTTADLDGSWMGGVVESGGVKVSRDMWRQTAKGVERFAFSSSGLFVRLSSPGWSANKLVFNGTAGDTGGEFPLRETITKLSETKMHALWERQGADGKWTVFSDETCTRTSK